MTDSTADYLALRREVGAVDVPRDVIAARGPDAVAFLQGQLSQDVAALPPGSSAWALLLQPQGKVVAFLRVSSLAAEELVLDVDAGWGEQVRARLERFKLRTRCDLEPLPDWRCVALRGPGVTALDLGATAPPPPVVAPLRWPLRGDGGAGPGGEGLPGVDLLGPAVGAPDGVRRCGLDAYEAVRVESGVPAMGSELDESTIPAEAGPWLIEASVSFTKGCYTGQELVARVDSRGSNTPRKLRGVVVAANVLPPVGAAVVVDGADVGRLTSVAESLDRRAPVALAYVRRAVEPPTEAVIRWEGGEAPARVEPLPLV